MRLKIKKEKRKKKENCKEGRGKKPKIQAYLNSQVIKKVNKVKKQTKTSEKSYMFNNEITLIKTCTTSLF